MRYAKATWHGPVPNMTTGGMGQIRGLVLHIMEGSIESCDNWFHNPTAQVSAHFGNAKDGRLFQWVDTENKAWAEADGNPNWISVENEGVAPTQLTPQQLENAAQLFAWVCKTYKVPCQVTDNVNGQGLAYHGMGGVAWGNHPDCPGTEIIAQRPEIVARAKAILAPAPVKVIKWIWRKLRPRKLPVQVEPVKAAG